MKLKKLCKAILLGSGLITNLAFADDHKDPESSDAEKLGELNFSGWVRADYGTGDRYSEASGEDQLGVSQAALVANWKYDNVEAVVVLGATNLTEGGSDGDVGIKDAFVVWHDIFGNNVDLSVGVQPLLFGLKSNGFPNDRSLQGSIEFGGAGGFAVSQQAGPSIIFTAPMGENFNLRAGLFDTSSSTAEYFENTGLGNIDGSSLTDNYFLQFTLGNKTEKGFYGVLGFEGRYVGGATNDTQDILDIGFGYNFGQFDISLEHIQLDNQITNTIGDESYTVLETTYTHGNNWYYIDYSEADEIDVSTLRAGFGHNINKHFSFRVEYSKDDHNLNNNDVDSIDFRLTFSM